MGCPMLNYLKGINAYYEEPVNSDGEGCLLPLISNTDLLELELRKERHIKKYGKTKTLNETLRGEDK